jgi:hypothetical protein
VESIREAGAGRGDGSPGVNARARLASDDGRAQARRRASPPRSAALLGCLLVGAALAPTARAQESLYSVGNSLTDDCCLDNGIAEFAIQNGLALNQGYHIYHGMALDVIVANPATYSFVSPAEWNQALPGYAWSAVALEPYPSSEPSTMADDLAAIEALISATQSGPSVNPVFYIFAAWPAQTSVGAMSYSDYWYQPVPNSLSQPTVLAHQYFANLLAALNAVYGPNVPIAVIYVGDAFAALDQQVEAGNFPGITSVFQFYRDANHLSDAGRLLAGATVYASMYGTNPVGLSAPAAYMQGYAGVPITPDIVVPLETIAWQVAASTPGGPVIGPANAADAGSGDGPLPVWALVLLGAGIVGVARRRLR